MSTENIITLGSLLLAIITTTWSVRETLRVRKLENIRDLLGEKETVAFAAVQLLRQKSLPKKRRAWPWTSRTDPADLFDAIICACVFESSDRARAILYDVIYEHMDTHRDEIKKALERVEKVFDNAERYGLDSVETDSDFNLAKGRTRLNWVELVIAHYDRHHGGETASPPDPDALPGDPTLIVPPAPEPAQG